MRKATHEKKYQDWSEDGQVFFCDGKGYGLTPNLNTICLGKEEDIEAFISADMRDEPAPREVVERLNVEAKVVLHQIGQARKEQRDGEQGDVSKQKTPVDKQRSRIKRTRSLSDPKHYRANIKHSPQRKRVPLRSDNQG